MTPVRGAPGRYAALAAIIAIAAAPGRAETARIPVPAAIIYPGDIIADRQIAESAEPHLLPEGGALTSRADIIGKTARRTLLPGRPIAADSIEAPRLVSAGGNVNLVFDFSGVKITALGQALQGARAGEPIRVRNIESGLSVSGIVQPDGSVSVGGF